MKATFFAAAALLLVACSGVPSTSQSFLARPLLNDTTIGGSGYPIVITGAEHTGLTAQTLAQNLRFPARLPAGSNFQAVGEDTTAVNVAHLDIGANGASTLTFLHGFRRIGVGEFSLPLQSYADPQALGSTSATLISTMLRESRQSSRGNNRVKFY